MNRFFHKYLGKFVLLYLGDILVFSKNEEDQKLHMKKVFKFFKNANYMWSYSSANLQMMNIITQIMWLVKVELKWTMLRLNLA
jgi:hypothetical protein